MCMNNLNALWLDMIHKRAAAPARFSKTTSVHHKSYHLPVPVYNENTRTVMRMNLMKKGITIFVEAGVDAILQYLQELHNWEVIQPKNASKLSGSDKKGYYNTKHSWKGCVMAQLKKGICRGKKRTRLNLQGKSIQLANSCNLISIVVECHRCKGIWHHGLNHQSVQPECNATGK